MCVSCQRPSKCSINLINDKEGDEDDYNGGYGEEDGVGLM